MSLIYKSKTQSFSNEEENSENTQEKDSLTLDEVLASPYINQEKYKKNEYFEKILKSNDIICQIEQRIYEFLENDNVYLVSPTKKREYYGNVRSNIHFKCNSNLQIKNENEKTSSSLINRRKKDFNLNPINIFNNETENKNFDYSRNLRDSKSLLQVIQTKNKLISFH